MARPSNRDRILDALETVILERGASAATLDAVCAAAEVSKGGLLYHFASKAELFAGLNDRLAAAVEQWIADAPSEPAELIRWYLRPVDSDDPAERALWRSLLASIHGSDNDGSTSLALGQIVAGYGKPLEALDPQLAQQVRLLSDGIYFNALVGAPPAPLELLDAVAADLIARL